MLTRHKVSQRITGDTGSRSTASLDYSRGVAMALRGEVLPLSASRSEQLGYAKRQAEAKRMANCNELAKILKAMGLPCSPLAIRMLKAGHL